MTDRILCVDDEPHVLAGIQRQYRKQYHIDVAPGGAEGLALMQAQGPYAVLVSDMRMPGMNGAQFLAKAREMAPDTVRMLLTGYADQQAAIAAVNEGNIFRFLTKPCPHDTFTRALQAGIEQYRLITAEKELLEKTLHGSVKALTEVLGLVNPLAFGRTSRVQRIVQGIAKILEMENAWQVEMAAMLCLIGCVTVPETILSKAATGLDLNAKEYEMFHAHPRIGQNLIGKIPRLEPVAEIIAYQEKHFDGQGLPEDAKQEEEIPQGARILKAALDYDSLISADHSPASALERLNHRPGWYDQDVLRALAKYVAEQPDSDIRTVFVRDMRCQMIVAEDVLTTAGLVLMGKGQEINEALLYRLHNFSTHGAIREPIKVLVPPPRS